MSEVKYHDAEDAFFAMVQRQKYKAAGSPRIDGFSPIQRPGYGLDTQMAVNRLVSCGKLSKSHQRILAEYGRCGFRPDERSEDFRLWDEAMKIISIELEKKGMVQNGL